MNTKIIESYIQFGLDNGFEFNLKKISELPIEDLIQQREIYNQGNYYLDEPRLDINGILMIPINIIKGGFIYKGYISIYETIISKDFIKAIARGYEKKLKWASIKEYYYDNKGNKYDSLEEIIDKITTEQAIAIRDGELENFITNLGILGTKQENK